MGKNNKKRREGESTPRTDRAGQRCCQDKFTVIEIREEFHPILINIASTPCSFHLFLEAFLVILVIFWTVAW